MGKGTAEGWITNPTKCIETRKNRKPAEELTRLGHELWNRVLLHRAVCQHNNSLDFVCDGINSTVSNPMHLLTSINVIYTQLGDMSLISN